MSRVPSSSQMKSSDEFKKRFNAIIAEQDCSIYEFAEKAGVSRGVVTRAAIYGIIPSVKILIRICNYLKVSFDYIACMSDDKAFEPSQEQTTFHERIILLCERKKLNFSQVALHMPFDKNLFYDWQRVKTLPSLEYLCAIAKYFDVSLDYLLGRSD